MLRMSRMSAKHSIRWTKIASVESVQLTMKFQYIKHVFLRVTTDLLFTYDNIEREF